MEIRSTTQRIDGLILAGGEAKRLADKPFRQLGDCWLIEHVIARSRPQVGRLAISVRETGRFGTLGLKLIPDAGADSDGPVAGLVAGLKAAAGSGAALLATFPCDAPFLPHDLVARLADARGTSGVAVPVYDGSPEPAFGLWQTSLADQVEALLGAGMRRLRDVARTVGMAPVAFSAVDGGSPFFNINTEADLAAAESRIGEGIG